MSGQRYDNLYTVHNLYIVHCAMQHTVIATARESWTYGKRPSRRLLLMPARAKQNCSVQAIACKGRPLMPPAHASALSPPPQPVTGTPLFLAPECFKQCFGMPSDTW